MKFSALALFVAAVAPSPFHVVEADLTRGVRNRGGDPTKKQQGTRTRILKGILKGTEDDGKILNDGKGKGGTLGVCDNCASRLPGYNFWGQSYLEEDFYSELRGNRLRAPEAAYELRADIRKELRTGNDVVTDEQMLDYVNEIGFCYALEDLDIFRRRHSMLPGIPTGSQLLDGKKRARREARGCLFLTVISELIYQSETLRCLLMSLSKTSRDTICFLADLDGVPNPDNLGRRSLSENPTVQKIMERRQLNPISGGGGAGITITGDEMLDFLTLVSKGSAEGGRRLEEGATGMPILGMFGITEDAIMAATRAKLGCDKDGADCSFLLEDEDDDEERRDLQFEIRENGDELGSGGIIQFIGGFIDVIAQSDQAFRLGTYFLDLGWFDKCLDSLELVEDLDRDDPIARITCGVIYTLEKTEDAIFCEDSKICDIPTKCTPNQKIETEYTSRRIARALPNDLLTPGEGSDGPFNFLVADILAPCSSCENECAAFCWYQENFHQCDDYKRAYLAIVGDGDYADLDYFEGTDELGLFYNVELPLFLAELFGIPLPF